MMFDIIENNIHDNGIEYNVTDSYGGTTSSTVFISITENNVINITYKDSYSYLNGNYILGNKDQIIQIADENQNIGDPDAPYDDEYCIKYYDDLRFTQYGITLDDVKSYYENRDI